MEDAIAIIVMPIVTAVIEFAVLRLLDWMTQIGVFAGR